MQIVKQMSLKSKKYLITTEKHEVIEIHQRQYSIHKYCPQCKQLVEMLTLDAITSATGKSTRELFQLVENHSLHSLETERGHLLICRESLEAIMRDKIRNKINE